MDFSDLVGVTDRERRCEIAQAVLSRENWSDELVEACEHGGWPGEFNLEYVEFETAGKEIVVLATVSFTELVYGGCDTLEVGHEGEAKFEIHLCPETFEVNGFKLRTSESSEEPNVSTIKREFGDPL